MFVSRSLTLTTAAALLLAAPAFAVGTTSTPPTPTQTTTACPEGSVYDTTLEACVVIQESRFEDDDALVDTARELAYFGRYGDALDLLAMAADPDHSMVLTYQGFALRRSGDLDTALGYYERALDMNPDNHLARAYMGMGYLEAGDMELAALQLDEIRTRGGAGTWPEQALADALATGTTYNY